VRGVLAGLAALAISIPSVWASAQSEISGFLPAGKTILTAKAADLATAVNSAILTNTDVTLTPALIAAAAFEPVGGKVRSDRNSSAPVVVDKVVSTFITSGSANFATEVGSVVDAVVSVNGTAGNTSEVLSISGQEAVVKDALGTISDQAVTTGTGILAADQAIGSDLVNDTVLESSGKILTVLQDGIEGINGVKGKSAAEAPVAAEDFVAGLLSGATLPGVPGAPTPGGYSSFAVNILKNVAKNASVDELVSYQVGLKDNASTTNLVSLAEALILKYSSDSAKIVQGVAAVTPQATGEAGRASFVNQLVAATSTTKASAHAVAIDQGAAFVDPFYASTFTASTFAALETAAPAHKLSVKYAPALATGIGNILGQDGNELTQVASVFADLTGSNILTVSKTSTYATDLISGAVKSKIPTSMFTGAAAGGGGGTLVVGNGKDSTTLATGTAIDFASIINLFSEGILKANGTSTAVVVKTDATEIGALAEAVVKFIKNENVTITIPNEGTSEPVAVYLAGTLGAYLNSLGLPNTPLTGSLTPEQVILASIVKDVEAATERTIRPLVAAVMSNLSNYSAAASATSGPIAVQETPVTNL